MTTLDAASVAVLDWLAETTLHVAVLVVVILVLIRLLGRRLTPRWRYALWGLVVVRLLLPVVPESPVSVHNLASVVAQAPDAAPRDGVAAEAPTSAAPGMGARRPARDTAVASSSGDQGVGLPTLPAATSVPDSTALTVPWWQSTLVALWIAGAALVGAWWIVVETRLRRRLRSAAVLDAPHVRRALDTAYREARVRRRPVVLATDAVSAPALTGVLRPRLLLPAKLADAFDEHALLCVFRHELAHLRAGDVLVNWVLAALSALHWFDPLVWLAFSRFRAERESVRDWSALARAEGDGRDAYGETLVRLMQHARGGGPRCTVAVGILESKREMRRRITMIATYRNAGLRGRLLGAAVVLCASVVALTGATTDLVPARAQDRDPVAPPAQPESSLPTVRVERETAETPEDAAVRAKLRGPAVASVHGAMTLHQVVGAYREGLGANFVVSVHAQEEAEDSLLEMPAAVGLTAEQHLRFGLRQQGLDVGVRDAVVYIGTDSERVGSIDRRIYDIRPIMEMLARRRRAAELAEDPEAELMPMEEYMNAEDIIALLQNCVQPWDAWTRTDTSVATTGDLLVIRQTADMHEKAHAFLDQLLNFGEDPRPPMEPWKTALLDGLTRAVTVSVEDAQLGDVAASISSASGVRVVADADCADRPVKLDLTDIPARQAVEWCARIAGVHSVLRDGAVVFSRTPETDVRLYDVGDIVRAERGAVVLDALVEMLMDIEPTTWEEIASAEAVWPDMLVVRNTPAAHEGIERLLATLRRVQKEE